MNRIILHLGCDQFDRLDRKALACGQILRQYAHDFIATVAKRPAGKENRKPADAPLPALQNRISFPVTPEVWRNATSMAESAGLDVDEWARRVIVGSLSEGKEAA